MAAEPTPSHRRAALAGLVALALLAGALLLLGLSALFGSSTQIGSAWFVATRSQRWQFRRVDTSVSPQHPDRQVTGLQLGPLVWAVEWQR